MWNGHLAYRLFPLLRLEAITPRAEKLSPRGATPLGGLTVSRSNRFQNEKIESVYVLGIETSCDETAAAVVGPDRRLLSNVVASQIDTHLKYGGVVPELASREHLRAIVPVVRQALEDASIEYKDLDALAVTEGPGLVGSLLVGLTFAKGLAASLRIPFLGINHIEGHIHAVIFEHRAEVAGSSSPPSRWSLAAATPISSSSNTKAEGTTATACWAALATTPPEKLSIKWPSCSAWGTRAGR